MRARPDLTGLVREYRLEPTRWDKASMYLWAPFVVLLPLIWALIGEPLFAVS